MPSLRNANKLPKKIDLCYYDFKMFNFISSQLVIGLYTVTVECNHLISLTKHHQGAGSCPEICDTTIGGT